MLSGIKTRDIYGLVYSVFRLQANKNIWRKKQKQTFTSPKEKEGEKSNAIIANAGNDDVYQIKKQVLPYFFRYYTQFSG
jgi:hypothetical protein